MNDSDRNVLFSSKTMDWGTPQWLYDQLNEEFKFTLDACATENNKKHPNYISPQQDSLKTVWSGSVWVNPPYSRKVGVWVKHAQESISAGDASVVVMLLPARTCTKWFHNYIYQKSGVEIRFLRGRLQFIGAKHKAPFPSMICIFRKKEQI